MGLSNNLLIGVDATIGALEKWNLRCLLSKEMPGGKTPLDDAACRMRAIGFRLFRTATAAEISEAGQRCPAPALVMAVLIDLAPEGLEVRFAEPEQHPG